MTNRTTWSESDAQPYDKSGWGVGGGKTLVLKLAALLAVASALVAFLQNEVSADEASAALVGQIVVRTETDGDIEFAFRPSGAAPIFPRARFLRDSSRLSTGRWAYTSAVVADNFEIGRISVRRAATGGLEVAFVSAVVVTHLLPGERVFQDPPPRRSGDRWHATSTIQIPLPTPAGQQPSRAEKEAAVLAVLFRGEPSHGHYNDWGCPDLKDVGDRRCDIWGGATSSSRKGYIGGHSGWDAQTLSVAGDDKTDDERFYSLTPGEVIAIGRSCKTIYVWDRATRRTVQYLHARRVDVRPGTDNAAVGVGSGLGIQGNACLLPAEADNWSETRRRSYMEHVHIEVHVGRVTIPSDGARGPERPTCDPIDFLYWSVTGRSGAPPPCNPSAGDSAEGPTAIDGSPVTDGSLIKRRGSNEIYLAKIVDNQRYKRLFLTWDQLAVDDYRRTAPQLEVSRSVFDSFAVSCIMQVRRFASVEFWYLGAAERADRSSAHRVDAADEDLEAAGIPSAAIFDIDAEELSHFNTADIWTASRAAAANCGS